MTRPHPPRTRIERDIVEAEQAVQDFAHAQQDVRVCILRFANGLGATLNTAYTRMLRMPGVPAILGFDPRIQLIHEDDIVGVLAHAVQHELEGIYNGAADGVLALSEMSSLLGKPVLPLLPPWGTATVAHQLRRAGIDIPDEVLQHLRFGRGLDNRRLKATGYRFRYTNREAVLKFREALQVTPLRGSSQEPYRYEREVEEFLRYSPSVRGANREEAGRLHNRAAGERPELERSTPE
jgi:UDP-glucose 4-epimerase